jgi:hypothetical protein
MDLWRGQAGAIGIDHGLDHVGDQAADFGRRGVRNLIGAARQDRMAHAGDFQDCHDPKYGGQGHSVKEIADFDRFFSLPRQYDGAEVDRQKPF